MATPRAVAILGDVVYAVGLTLIIPLAIIIIGLPMVLLVRLVLAIAGQF